MKKLLKWTILGIGIIVVLLIAAIIIIPQVVDVQKYKPQIEKAVTDATGRPFKLGGDLDVSVFPWVGVSLSDLSLGNPEGFEKKAFVTIKAFEVRVKLMPLLSKKIEVKQFVMQEPEIFLTKLANGRTNWEDLGKSQKKDTAPLASKKESKEKKTKSDHLPISSLAVGKFSISKGRLVFNDAGKQKEISDIYLDLKNVSLDKQIEIMFRANADGHPVVIDGKVGPLGKEPGKGTVPLEISLDLFKELKIAINGMAIDPLTAKKFDLTVDIAPFSPRKIMAALDRPFPVKTADPAVMNKIALKATVKGSASDITLSDGSLTLDDSTLTLMLAAKDFEKPDVVFDINLDQIDVDRYLPPKPAKKEAKKPDTKPETKPDTKPKDKADEKKGETDYAPLRKMIVDGTVKIGKLTASNAKIENFVLKINGENGVFDIDPLSLDFYQGHLLSTVNLDVTDNKPVTRVTINTKGIQVGPLLHDIMQKDVLGGSLESDIALKMKGDGPEMIKQTLNGNGNLVLRDGTIIGIDLAGMVRNIASQFGIGEELKEKPKTDFAELDAPFTITNGRVNTPGTTLVSPLLRVVVKGDAHLVKKSIDMRIEPKFVGTLKGQGDSKQRTGISVPVIVTGTFDDPKFRPDLEGIIDLNNIDTESLKKNLRTKDGRKETVKELEETGKSLLKGLFSD